ncbi:MAG: 30S ribosomal protein S6 [Alphaproteobacteria bacterium]|nr:30S ribosomal protein S6 [Alphaproteobacteria bacterium]OJV16261.1 MAG: 30S ribosomal protein S6 [Alphaproteobacteria bacterium 33-17]
MAKYETTFIVRQDMSPNEVDKLADNYIGVIEQMGGTLVKKEYWGLRNLAYIIKKGKKGHYIMLGLDAPFEAVKEIRRQMSINEDIIREVTLRVEEISKNPSLMMKQNREASNQASEEIEE